MAVEPMKAIEIFYSYAHEDEALRNELNKHLSVLKQQGLITDWYDRNISAGTKWEQEIDIHLNTAHIILLLVSPDFLASHYCSSVEMKRAMERHEAGEARVIPIILREVDWKGAPFDKLQVLPTNGKPVKSGRNCDKAFLDVAQGIRKAVEELHSTMTNSEKTAILRYQYCDALYERWKMLDFRGIMHADMNKPIRMPLTEVFVFPDVLAGVPEDETLEREELLDPKGEKSRVWQEDERTHPTVDRERSQRREKRASLQREKLPTVLAKHHRLVILGDPGSGKSTLLRYLLLQLILRSSEFVTFFPQLTEILTTVPLYFPLASYADVWFSKAPGSRSLEDFLPGYLHENYLGKYVEFLQGQIKQGKTTILLDGLDEIPDASLRLKIVQQIEMFAQTYPRNRFIVTSRIVGYREAPLAAEYQAYTLADFNEEQIKTFTQKWCPAYECWVKETTESQYLKDAATKEAEKLFQATQRNQGVKRLAVNPLLLTILALIQRQGIDLPSHRVELFELCAMTLLDTWVKAKGLAETANFRKNDLIKILRPLAFWMHQHPAVGAIPEEELMEQVVKQLLDRKIALYEEDARKLAEQFLHTVHGKTGILIERGKQRYGFLHLTFEEYFAAGELVVRKKDREDFIKNHLHDPRWREVILLAVSIIGLLQNDEEGVTELVQKAILEAGSLFETWLHRDLLFAGLCLADDIGVSIACEDEIIEQIVSLYITSPYDSLRDALSSMLTAWSGTRAATKLANLVLCLLNKWEIANQPRSFLIARLSDVSSSKFEDDFAACYKYLIYQYKEAQNKLLPLYSKYLILHDQTKDDTIDQFESALVLLPETSFGIRQSVVTTLGQIGSDEPRIIDALLQALSDANLLVRRAAAIALGQVGSDKTAIIDALLQALSDIDWIVRYAAIHALGQNDSDDPRLVDALLQALSDPDSDVREVGATAFRQITSAQPHVVDTLFQNLSDSYSPNRETAVIAFGQIGSDEPRIVDALLQTLSDSDLSVRREATIALGQIGSNDPRIIDTMLQALSDKDWVIRYAATQAIGHIGSDEPRIVDALLQTLSDSDLSVRREATIALGQIGSNDPRIIDTMLQALSDKDWVIRYAATQAIGHIGSDEPRIVDVLLQTLSDPNLSVRQEAISALGQTNSDEPRIVDALLQTLSDPNLSVRQEAVRALGQVGNNEPRIIDTLLQALFDPESEVREAVATALGQIGSDEIRIIDTLLQALFDPEPDVRAAVTTTLGQVGSDEPRINKYLSDLLSLSSFTDNLQEVVYQQKLYIVLTKREIKLLGEMKVDQPEIVDALLQALLNPYPDIRVEVVSALGQTNSDEPRVIDALLQTLSDSNLSIRQEAVSALGQTNSGEPRVIDALLQTLSDSNLSIRREAVSALGQTNSGEPRVIDALLQTLSDKQLSYVAGTSLGQIGGAEFRIIDSLLQLLTDPSSDIREAAARALGQVGNAQPRVIDALLQALSIPDASVRQAAAISLGQIGGAEFRIIDFLLQLLTDPNSDVREAAARALGQVGNAQPRVIDALLQALSDPNSDVREAAARALGQVGNAQPRVIDALLQALSIPVASVRQAAAISLGQIGRTEPRIIDDLLKVLFDPYMPVRYAVATSLGQIGRTEPRIIDNLLKTLSDIEATVRQAAATSLGQIGRAEPRIIDALIQMLYDNDLSITNSAATALAALRNVRNVVALHIEELLYQNEPVTRKQLEADHNINALLLALQQVMGPV